MSRQTSPDDADRLWWEKTFKEREDLLRDRFGETKPPGWVMSFSWNDPHLIIPGGCSLCFIPSPPERPHWLYLSHGLTQPLEPEPPVPGAWSGYGCEFGILANTEGDWAFEALYQLLSYVKSANVGFGVGDRVPIAYFDTPSEDKVRPELGMVQEDGPSPLGLMRALLFWTYLAQPKPLWTTTGYFDLLVGVTITNAEWEMAKETSSGHVLYLLSRAGIGQVSDLRRTTVTDDPRWSIEWESIRRLPREEVEKRLVTTNR